MMDSLTYQHHRCRWQKSFHRIRWLEGGLSLQSCQKELPSSSQSVGRIWAQEGRILSKSVLKKNTSRWLHSAPVFSVGCEQVLHMRNLPQKTSLGQDWGRTLRSCRGDTTPSMLPNIVERPRQKSMMKKSTAQRGEIGILMMASVNTMKAKPVPSTPWRCTGHISQVLIYWIFVLTTRKWSSK